MADARKFKCRIISKKISKKTFVVIFLFLCWFMPVSKANMASPYVENDYMASIITSKEVDVLHERIEVTIQPRFQGAKFHVTYHIRSNEKGKTIPLLFYAKKLKKDFRVFVDKKPVKVFGEVPEEYYAKIPSDNGTVKIRWNISGDGSTFEEDDCPISELVYFELPITQETHQVEIEYDASASIDKSHWVKRYFIPYSLAPAKYWKSFGKLEIIIKQEQPLTYTTNLGSPKENQIGLLNTWTFDKIPADYFVISYQPEINSFAKLLIKVNPYRLTLISQILLFIFFIYQVIRYRKKHPQSPKNKWILWGTIVTSFYFPFGLYLFYELVDLSLGAEKENSPSYGMAIIGIIYIIWGVFLLVGAVSFGILKLVDSFVKKSLNL